MTNDNILQLWASGAYTECELCQGLRISHFRLRRLLKAHGVPLPAATKDSISLHRELYNRYNNPENEKTISQLASLYGITTHLAHDFTRRTPPKEVTNVTAEMVQRYIMDNDATTREVMDHFGITRYTLNKLADGLHQPRAGRRASEETATTQSLIADMLAKGIKQADIAERLGVSQSYISRSNPNKRSQARRAALDDATWMQLKACKHMYSLRQLASLFSVSKSYIQERLKREASLSGVVNSNKESN